MAQNALAVAVKGPCLFLKARFQTYAQFSYLLHNNVMLISSTVKWQKQCLVNVKQPMFHSCCGNLRFSARNRTGL